MLQVGFIFSCTVVLYYFLSYINQYLLFFNNIINWDFFSANFAHMCVSILSVLLCALFFGRVSGFHFKDSLQIKKDHTSVITLLLSALIGVVLVPLVAQVNNVFIQIFSPILKNTESTLMASPSTFEGLFCLIGTHALYPAFADELFFRGVLIAPIRSRLSPKVLIWFSALLYALSHFSLKILAATFILGAVFSIETHKTKSLLPSMITHFVYSAFSLIVNFFSVDWILLADFGSWAGYLAFAIKLFSSFTLIFIILNSFKNTISVSDNSLCVSTSTVEGPVEEDLPKFRMLDFVSFLPGAFLLLMSFMHEITIF